MPELPEVEVTRLSFAERIQNAEIRAIHGQTTALAVGL